MKVTIEVDGAGTALPKQTVEYEDINTELGDDPLETLEALLYLAVDQVRRGYRLPELAQVEVDRRNQAFRDTVEVFASEVELNCPDLTKKQRKWITTLAQNAVRGAH